MDACGSSGPARTADPRTVRRLNVKAEGTALAARGQPVTQQMCQSPHVSQALRYLFRLRQRARKKRGVQRFAAEELRGQRCAETGNDHRQN